MTTNTVAARVPFAAPARLQAAEAAAISDAIARVVTDGPWILGPEVERFEKDFAEYLGTEHVIGVGNGTDALAIAFSSLGLAAGSGVLVAANEGGYAATAARLVGLEPVVVDVDEFSMVPGPAQAQVALTANASAIVVTHLHGEATDIHELDAWRREHGLALIEDCAQAHGARRDGVHVGLTGDAATFSFYPTKNLGAVGDAGAVTFSDATHASTARKLREYGWGERFRIELAGGRNSRLDSLQAAILSARLPYLDARNDVRRAISARYRAAISSSSARIHGDPETTVAHHSIVLTDRRDELAALFASRDIQTSVHYPFLLGDMPGLGLSDGVPVPVATLLRDSMLSLPCFPEMTDDEINRVVTTLTEWSNGPR